MTGNFHLVRDLGFWRWCSRAASSLGRQPTVHRLEPAMGSRSRSRVKVSKANGFSGLGRFPGPGANDKASSRYSLKNGSCPRVPLRSTDRTSLSLSTACASDSESGSESTRPGRPFSTATHNTSARGVTSLYAAHVQMIDGLGIGTSSLRDSCPCAFDWLEYLPGRPRPSGSLFLAACIAWYIAAN